MGKTEELKWVVELNRHEDEVFKCKCSVKKKTEKAKKLLWSG